MRAAWIHGILLVLALLVAYRTWAREEVTEPETERITVWEGEPEDVISVTHTTGRRTLRITRRQEGDDPYLWGTEIRHASREGPPGDTTATAPGPEETSEFPIGVEGEDLLELLAPLRALRELSDVSEEAMERYGLQAPEMRLRVEVADETREVLVGGSVYGGGNRYAMEPAGERVYVLPMEIFRKLAGGEGALRERQLHDFTLRDVARVTVRTPSGERTMLHTAGDVPARATWAPPGAPENPDQTFANFMERFEQLWVSGYEPDLSLDAAELIVRVDYLDDDGRALGFLELYRKAGDGESDAAYYLVTETTRVPGLAYAPHAQRVAEDVEQLF